MGDSVVVLPTIDPSGSKSINTAPFYGDWTEPSRYKTRIIVALRSGWLSLCAFGKSALWQKTEGFQRRIKFMYASTDKQTAEDPSRFQHRSAHHRSIRVPSLARHGLEMA